MRLFTKIKIFFNLLFFLISLTVWVVKTAPLVSTSVTGHDLWVGFGVLYSYFEFKLACIFFIAINGIADTIDFISGWKRYRSTKLYGTKASLETNLDDLKECVDQFQEKYIHFVGHSMGGLIIRAFFERYPEQKPGRIVSIGTPHQGASIANAY